MRIEPRRPHVNVNFLEWDGLIRLCFSRKNKTLGAIFRQPSTLALMHSNYQLLQALSAPGQGEAGKLAVADSATLPSSIAVAMDIDDEAMNMSEEEGEDDVMDVDGDDTAAKKKVRRLCFDSLEGHDSDRFVHVQS